MDKKNNHEPEEKPEETIDEPVMDGASETYKGTEDPRKGETDPALIRHPDREDKTTAPYNL